VSEPRRLALVQPDPQLCEHGNPGGWLDFRKLNLRRGECRRAAAEADRLGRLREREGTR
jgi:hypothetical protein